MCGSVRFRVCFGLLQGHFTKEGGPWLDACTRWDVGRRADGAGCWAAWLLLLVVVGVLGTTLNGKITTEFSVPGIESQQAQDLLKAKFPAAAGGVARVVFAAPGHTTLTDSRRPQARSTPSLKDAAAVPGVVAVSDPAKTGTISADRTIGYADVHFRQAAADVPQSAKDRL